MTSAIAALPPPTHQNPAKPITGDGSDVPEYSFNELWQDKEEGMSFGDVLDIINPLQHIPIISTIYRMATGDEVGMGSRIAGGALFGGPLGIFVSGLTAIIERCLQRITGLEPFRAISPASASPTPAWGD